MAKEEKESKVSPARAKFLELIERYKIQNPAKYEAKKEELQRKLDAIR